MQEKLKSLSKISEDFKSLIKNKGILDVIIFGSYIKGKVIPEDIDIVIITSERIEFEKEGYHISLLSFEDIFSKHHTLFNTLLREGYSLKYNKNFSELYSFKNKSLFNYGLSGLTNSNKVKVVNLLRGNRNQEGYIKEKKCEWVANNVFICPIESDNFFDKLFLNFNIKYTKKYLLIH